MEDIRDLSERNSEYWKSVIVSNNLFFNLIFNPNTIAWNFIYFNSSENNEKRPMLHSEYIPRQLWGFNVIHSVKSYKIFEKTAHSLTRYIPKRLGCLIFSGINN
jgi:hypothetical protein